MNSLFAQTRNSSTAKNLLKDIVVENLTIKDFILQLTRWFFLVKHKEIRNVIFSNGLFGSLEREESRGKKSSGEESRGERLSSTYLDVFKISKGKRSN